MSNGGISADGKTYTFNIRKGVKFQEGGDLTPEDVAYSLKRDMILDPAGGPMWMLLEALTGEGNHPTKTAAVIPGIFEKIDKAVEVKGDNVVLPSSETLPPAIGYFILFGLGHPG